MRQQRIRCCSDMRIHWDTLKPNLTVDTKEDTVQQTPHNVNVPSFAFDTRTPVTIEYFTRDSDDLSPSHLADFFLWMSENRIRDNVLARFLTNLSCIFHTHRCRCTNNLFWLLATLLSSCEINVANNIAHTGKLLEDRTNVDLSVLEAVDWMHLLAKMQLAPLPMPDQNTHKFMCLHKVIYRSNTPL